MAALLEGVSVCARVPASSANLGPGFDSVGLALGLFDECEATVEGHGLVIEVGGEGAGSLPDGDEHLVHQAMLATWRALGVEAPRGLRLVCRNAIPQGRGLGSSAAAIVTGVVAAQGIHALSVSEAAGASGAIAIDRQVATDVASAMEGHPDNASASVHGGMTLSWTDDDEPGRFHTVSLPVHPSIEATVLVPSAELATSTARAVLPGVVPHREAALNGARAALLVEAMGRRPELLMPATREWLHQEQRRAAFPATMELLDALRVRGCAAVVSGAGPSLLVLGTAAQRDVIRQVVDEARGTEDAGEWRVLRPGIPSEGAVVTARRAAGCA